jgi:multidrug efflux pump subunit AcrB
VDKEKAALNGISEDEVARTVQVASAGYQAGLLHAESDKEDVPLMVRLDRASRSDMERCDRRCGRQDGKPGLRR